MYEVICKKLRGVKGIRSVESCYREYHRDYRTPGYLTHITIYEEYDGLEQRIREMLKEETDKGARIDFCYTREGRDY